MEACKDLQTENTGRNHLSLRRVTECSIAPGLQPQTVEGGGCSCSSFIVPLGGNGGYVGISEEGIRDSG